MNMITVVRALGPIDARNIRRDSLLQWMIIMPFFFAFLFRYGVPWIRTLLLEQFAFDLAPYYVLLVTYSFVILIPAVFGMVIGFLLLDERDDRTLTALQVTPLTLNNYLSYRILLPMILSVLLTLITFPLASLVPFNFGHILLVALLSAPFAPMFALYLAAFANNKVQGFALMKASGVIFILPVIAYFIQSNWQFVFGIVPTFWPAKLFWALLNGDTAVWLYLGLGIVVQTGFLFLFARRFNQIMYR